SRARRRKAAANSASRSPLIGSRWCNALFVRSPHPFASHLEKALAQFRGIRLIRKPDAVARKGLEFLLQCRHDLPDLPRAFPSDNRPQRTKFRGTREESPEGPVAYSITSSARAMSVCGSSRPSALAVLRLITSSNLVGPSTGSSPTLAPLKMRSTYKAA